MQCDDANGMESFNRLEKRSSVQTKPYGTRFDEKSITTNHHCLILSASIPPPKDVEGQILTLLCHPLSFMDS